MSPSQLVLMLAEAGLARQDADDLTAMLSPLAALPDEAVPTPSAELLRLFDGEATAQDSLTERRSLQQGRGVRTRRTIAGVVVLAVSGVGATGMSAAANTLPSFWQHQVADFSRHYLPFDFPEPATRPKHPSGRAPDAGRVVRRDGDVFGERRRESTEATRSATREDSAANGAPAWQGLSPGTDHASADHSEQQAPGYSLPGTQPDEAPAYAETSPPTGNGSGQGAHGSNGDRDRSKALEGTEGRGKGETGKPDDHSEQSDRPVKGGGAGGPKDGQKGPQKGPQKGAQPGQPTGGVDQGQPGKGQSGDDGNSGSPNGPQEPPPPSEPGDQGSAGQGQPTDKDDLTGPVGDSLSGLAHRAEPLLGQ